MTPPRYIENVALADRTTLGLGGPARRLATVAGPEELGRVLDEHADWPVAVLGSGSNLVVADRGFDGLVLEPGDRTMEYDPASGGLHVGGGVVWDDAVSLAVRRRAAGIECLAGIPGLCGAAPVQNIGAYGQELSTVVESVVASDLTTGSPREFDAAECGFGYRTSRFKHAEAGRWMIHSVRLRLRPGGAATLAYRELQERLAAEARGDLARVHETVLALRRTKSMVLDPADPNRRSAGSFFTNPVVDEAVARTIGEDAPRWPVEDGRVKLAAAWLIEQAGFAKGYRQGAVGLSTRHALALVNLGGASSAELLGLARAIRDRVLDRFGVRLVPEPVPLGFEPGEVDDLWGDQADE